MEADIAFKLLGIVGVIGLQTVALVWWAALKSAKLDDVNERLKKLEEVLDGDKKVEWALWKERTTSRITDLEEWQERHVRPLANPSPGYHLPHRRTDD